MFFATKSSMNLHASFRYLSECEIWIQQTHRNFIFYMNVTRVIFHQTKYRLGWPNHFKFYCLYLVQPFNSLTIFTIIWEILIWELPYWLVGTKNRCLTQQEVIIYQLWQIKSWVPYAPNFIRLIKAHSGISRQILWFRISRCCLQFMTWKIME